MKKEKYVNNEDFKVGDLVRCIDNTYPFVSDETVIIDLKDLIPTWARHRRLFGG
jgi:hypothetical protein